MTLYLELPPDVQARLEAEAANRRLSLVEYALQKLNAPEETQNRPDPEATGESILQIVDEIYGSLPEAEQIRLPSDYATNYKHYLHGYPKASE